jgi:hypothetical protein
MPITLDGTAGTTTPALTNSALTSGRVTYAGTSGVLQDSANLTFDGTNFVSGGTVSATKLIPTGGAVTGNGIYLPAANTVAFSTNGAEVMRLNSSGSLLIGRTTTSAELGMLSVQGTIETFARQFNVFYTAGSAYEWVLRTGSNFNFIVNNATVTASLSSAGVWTNASDARYKENIADCQYGLSTVMALKPKSYNIIGEENKPQIGFIAQDVLDVVPEVVDSVFNSVTNEDRYTLSYGQLSAVLVKAIQELSTKLDVANTTIQELTARVAALEAK